MNWIFAGDAPEAAALMIVAGKAAALLALTLITGLFFRRASASTRHFLTTSAVLLAAALPLLTFMAPETKLPVPMIIKSRLAPGTISPSPSTAYAGEATLETAQGISNTGEVRSLSAPSRSVNILLYLWLLGTAVASGRVIIGLIGCAWKGHNARPLDSQRLLELVDKAAQRIGLGKKPFIMISTDSAVPHIYGIFKPTLILPYSVMQWPSARLVSVLRHELAHIKRKDNITWPLTNLAAAWLWFVPILWVMLARVKRDKERACDDYAVAGEKSSIGYAHHLLEACASVRTAVRPLPISFLFSRKSEVRERIVYMLQHGINRLPISRTGQIALVILLLAMAVPLAGIAGFSAPIILEDVTALERDAVMVTLESFYAELSNGSDYQSMRERFLTSDYYDDPRLTLESLDEAVWRPPFENTISLICEGGVSPAKEVRCSITDIARDGDELVVTQQIDVIADKIDGISDFNEAEGAVIRIPRTANGSEAVIAQCHLVKALVQQIRFRKEEGLWKISKFDDGVALMRMDTDNPYGPIFLVWMEDIDEETTPFGAGIFKIFPTDIIPDARNTKFVMEK